MAVSRPDGAWPSEVLRDDRSDVLGGGAIILCPGGGNLDETAVFVEQKRPDVRPRVRSGLRGCHVPPPDRPDPHALRVGRRLSRERMGLRATRHLHQHRR